MATEYFSDDFGTGLKNWTFDLGNTGSTWNVENNVLVAKVFQGNSSYLTLNNNSISNVSDYVFSAQVENDSGVDQVFHFKVSDDGNSYYQIAYRYNDPGWAIDNNDITMYRVTNGAIQGIASYPNTYTQPGENISQNLKHLLMVKFVGREIDVYFDNDLLIKYVDNSNYYLEKGGFRILNWGGSFGSATINKYYSITFSDGSVQPSPTPAVTKTIIIPGLGASWNTEAMVYNSTVPDSSWKMTPMVNIYDDLISAFKSNNLVQGKDFFVWNYDWRQPVASIENKLNEYINKNVGVGEKVNLVGHSLGALTARMWVQDHKNDPRIGKIISLAGPQMGVIDTYDAWNGAVINNKDLTTNMAMNLLLELQSKKGNNKVEILRKFAPVIHDLMPAFDFAKKKGNTVAVGKMVDSNNYLLTANLIGWSGLENTDLFVAGLGEKTKQWVNLGGRNSFDTFLGIWPDGKPASYDWSDGDGTVLKNSAEINGQTKAEISSNHGDIVEKSIPLVMTRLGLNVGTTSSGYNEYLKNKLVFLVGSPAILKLKCDNGAEATSDVDGFVYYDTVGKNQCQLSIVGTAKGIYHVAGGKIGSDNWNYWENETDVNKVETVVFQAGTGEIATDQSKDFWWQLVEYELKQLSQSNPKNRDLVIINDLARHKIANAVLQNIVNFRNKTGELESTGKILNYLVEIMSGDRNILSKNLAMLSIKQTDMVFDLEENLPTRPNDKTSLVPANNYLRAEELIVLAKNEFDLGNYTKAIAEDSVAKELLMSR